MIAHEKKEPMGGLDKYIYHTGAYLLFIAVKENNFGVHLQFIIFPNSSSRSLISRNLMLLLFQFS